MGSRERVGFGDRDGFADTLVGHSVRSRSGSGHRRLRQTKFRSERKDLKRRIRDVRLRLVLRGYRH